MSLPNSDTPIARTSSKDQYAATLLISSASSTIAETSAIPTSAEKSSTKIPQLVLGLALGLGIPLALSLGVVCLILLKRHNHKTPEEDLTCSSGGRDTTLPELGPTLTHELATIEKPQELPEHAEELQAVHELE
ncbi:hypothetical protein P154DRAFT_578080 [Amniculicola lignicola CBS 123094]|uniref:Mid2 domain-containing protein n=1 Tax=Amniculicola lignicola CBS 123094 TaxID=1392246 RepID=A0A6A5WBG6_9PLEO|nr:hypothetical protein P154DRAFT_578080 [Amniculicola lignicola CBS 123094]